jgi:hypothetical protein
MGTRISDAAESGDRRATLEAIRDKLSAELSKEVGRATAPIAKELVAVLRELDGIATAERKTTVDDLANRRATRRASAANS